MITFNMVFNDNTLNIFTDASMTKTDDDESVGCPGYVAVIGNLVVDRQAQILRESTNNESEVYAILMAIQFALANRNKVKVINIFSDSQFAVYGLREWIFKWMNNIQDDRLYNSSGKEVANQHIFMNIIYTILQYNLNVSIYHNRGHFPKSKTQEFIKLFKKHNFLNDTIDYQTASSIMYYNDMIDKYTRGTLQQNKFPNKLEMLDYCASNDLDMNHYKKLLNI